MTENKDKHNEKEKEKEKAKEHERELDHEKDKDHQDRWVSILKYCCMFNVNIYELTMNQFNFFFIVESHRTNRLAKKKTFM